MEGLDILEYTGEGYDRIFEAAKYSAMAGGKRLRPDHLGRTVRVDVLGDESFLAVDAVSELPAVHDDIAACFSFRLRDVWNFLFVVLLGVV